MGESWMAVAAEGSLEDAPVAGPVEDGAPGLQLSDAVGSFLRMELRHPPVVEHLAADHRVAEVGLPRVLLGDVGERRRDAALGHDGVGLAEQRLADEAHRAAALLGLDGRPQAGSPGADDDDVVGLTLDRVDHSRIWGSTK
jgi:hypothetical protein